MTIYKKLQVIQEKLKAPKSQWNKFGGYAFRSCEDILEAVKPLCAEVKAAVVLTDAIELIGGRYYVKATARLYDADIESFVENVAFAREDESKKGMDGAQLTGATSSYARKYALNGLFAIDDTKDGDSGETTAAPQSSLDPKLLAEAERLKIELANIAAYLKKPVENLTNEDLAKCIETKKKALEGAK